MWRCWVDVTLGVPLITKTDQLTRHCPDEVCAERGERSGEQRLPIEQPRGTGTPAQTPQNIQTPSTTPTRLSADPHRGSYLKEEQDSPLRRRGTKSIVTSSSAQPVRDACTFDSVPLHRLISIFLRSKLSFSNCFK